jgi:hypothetical protein
MAEQPLAKGGAEPGVGRRGNNAEYLEPRIPTLAQAGIDKTSQSVRRREPCLISPYGSYLHRWGNGRTQLSPAQTDGIWRVRIAWPNGAVHFVGKFTSEKDAIAWIEAHPWLTKPVADQES